MAAKVGKDSVQPGGEGGEQGGSTKDSVTFGGRAHGGAWEQEHNAEVAVFEAERARRHEQQQQPVDQEDHGSGQTADRGKDEELPFNAAAYAFFSEPGAKDLEVELGGLDDEDDGELNPGQGIGGLDAELEVGELAVDNDVEEEEALQEESTTLGLVTGQGGLIGPPVGPPVDDLTQSMSKLDTSLGVAADPWATAPDKSTVPAPPPRSSPRASPGLPPPLQLADIPQWGGWPEAQRVGAHLGPSGGAHLGPGVSQLGPSALPMPGAAVLQQQQLGHRQQPGRPGERRSTTPQDWLDNQERWMWTLQQQARQATPPHLRAPAPDRRWSSTDSLDTRALSLEELESSMRQLQGGSSSHLISEPSMGPPLQPLHPQFLEKTALARGTLMEPTARGTLAEPGALVDQVTRASLLEQGFPLAPPTPTSGMRHSPGTMSPGPLRHQQPFPGAHPHMPFPVPPHLVHQGGLPQYGGGGPAPSAPPLPGQWAGADARQSSPAMQQWLDGPGSSLHPNQALHLQALQLQQQQQQQQHAAASPHSQLPSSGLPMHRLPSSQPQGPSAAAPAQGYNQLLATARLQGHPSPKADQMSFQQQQQLQQQQLQQQTGLRGQYGRAAGLGQQAQQQQQQYRGQGYGPRGQGHYQGQYRSRYMTTEEIENIVRMQWTATHPSDPYVDDFYFQALQHKKSDATPHGRRHFAPAHLRDLPGYTKAAAEPHAFLQVDGLGRVPFSSIRRPRPLLEVDSEPRTNGHPEDNGTEPYFSSPRPLEQEPMLAARIAIEDGMCLLLDVDDIDRMLASVQLPDGGLQLRRRRQFLLEGLAASLQLLEPSGGDGPGGRKDYPVFLRLVSLPKGRKLITRYLTLLPRGSDLLLRGTLAVMRHLRFLFGSAYSDPGGAASTAGLAAAVAMAVSSLDLAALSQCLTMALGGEYPPLRPLRSPNGDGATVILRSLLDRATLLLSDQSVQLPEQLRAIWQARFDAFFNLLARHCSAKFEQIAAAAAAQEGAVSPAAAAALGAEVPVELLKASLPHTNDQQRAFLLDIVRKTVGGGNSFQPGPPTPSAPPPEVGGTPASGMRAAVHG